MVAYVLLTDMHCNMDSWAECSSYARCVEHVIKQCVDCPPTRMVGYTSLERNKANKL